MALVEVRTVLARAETALEYIERCRAQDGQVSSWNHEVYHADRDADEMIAELSDVVRRLDKWRRTGVKKRR